jgi:two-component system CheB/CheR fusion protein
MNEAGEPKDFEPLLDYLKRARGFDFTAYKRPSLMRRIEKRMNGVGIERFSDYVDYLEVHPDEFAQLFNNILINVTGFFRDESAWDLLRETVIPHAIGDGPSTHTVRIWSAGCASGEETYTIAMLLAEALGRDAFRDRVKIYATDVDDHALGQARAASYTERQVQPVPPALLDRYFLRENDRFVFDKDLRRSVIFGRHDLIQDAPISRVSILLCRNTLMYFNTEAQNRILARFHFALRPDGVLFLGKAEMLFTYSQLFTPIDLRRRVFKKIARDGWRDRLAIMNQAADDDGNVNHSNGPTYSAVLDAAPHAQIAIDTAGCLTIFNERARSIFNIVPGDLGRPIQDLEMSYRPVELRSLIEQATRERRPVAVKDVEWQTLGRDTRFFDVSVVPLFDGGARPIGVTVSFSDVSRIQELQTQLNRSRQDLETAYEELQSTNEELETTNEELQSTVEELETTNEELQSTNEELETMNEELTVGQRGAPDDQRGAAAARRRVESGQWLSRVDPHRPAQRRRRPRSRAARHRLEPARRGPLGPPLRRGAVTELSQPGHRSSDRPAPRRNPRVSQWRRRPLGTSGPGHEPAGSRHYLPGHGNALDRRG